MLAPGYPAFQTSSSVGNGSPILPTQSDINFSFSGVPVAGDIVTAQLLVNGVVDTSAPTVTFTVSSTLTATAVGAGIAAAIIAGTGDWSLYISQSHVTNAAGAVDARLVTASQWGLIGILLSLTLQNGSTLSVTPGFPKTAGINKLTQIATPTVPAQVVFSVIPLSTFPYSTGGQQMTFYAGEICDVHVSLGVELRAAGLAQ